MYQQLATTSDTLSKASSHGLGWSFPEPQHIPDSILQLSRPERASAASEIFSSGSVLNPEIIPNSADQLHTIIHTSISWQVSLLLLLTLSYYLLVLYRYRSNLPTLIRVTTSLKQTLMTFDAQNNEQIAFGVHSYMLLTLGLTITGVEYSQQMINTSPLILPIIFGSVLGLLASKAIALMLCQLFSDDKETFHHIRIINGHTASLVAIIYTPLAAAFASNLNQNMLLIWILAAIWIFYILRILGIFIKSRFGKLQWILYLCTVEIVPISLIIALALKSK